MSFSNEEFQFALELIIASRNENGSTLSDIQDDYNNAFGITFESMFGNCWTVYLRNRLLNSIDNIFTIEQPGQSNQTLFFIKVDELRKKILAAKENENMEAVLQRLNIDSKDIKQYRVPNERVQSSFNSTGLRSASSTGTYFRPTLPKPAEFYNHTLISDNFFLELSHIDLRMQKTRKNFVERIGLCISGQTIKAAIRTITYSPYQFATENVILNIGTFDLLSGRSVEEMIAEIVRLLNLLKLKALQPVLTTLAPLPNHPNGDIEERRQAFNKFIRENFDCIDIEKCFLTNENRVLPECYQQGPKPVGGSKHAITLWNRVGRQRVLQLVKREIPNIHPLF